MHGLVPDDDRWLDPAGQYEIDWGHPLAAGLVAGWVSGSVIAGRRVIANGSNAFPMPMGAGLAGRNAETDRSLAVIDAGVFALGTQPVSMLAVMHKGNGSTTSGVLCNVQRGGWTNEQIGVSWGVSMLEATNNQRALNNQTAWVNVVAPVQDGPHVLGCFAGDSEYRFYTDGALVATASQATPLFFSTSVNPNYVIVGSQYTTDRGIASSSGVLAVYVWTRRLTDASFASLHAAPFQFLRRIN